MATLIGDLLLWIAGNPDFLVLLVSFTFAVGLLYTVLIAWKFYEGRNEYERF